MSPHSQLNFQSGSTWQRTCSILFTACCFLVCTQCSVFMIISSHFVPAFYLSIITHVLEVFARITFIHTLRLHAHMYVHAFTITRTNWTYAWEMRTLCCAFVLVVIYVVLKHQITNAVLTLLVFLVMYCIANKVGRGVTCLFVCILQLTHKRFIAIVLSLIPAVLWNLYKTTQFASDIFYGPVTIQNFCSNRVGHIWIPCGTRELWTFFWIVSILMFVSVELHEKTKIFLPTACVMLVAMMVSYVFAHFARTDIHILRYVSSSPGSYCSAFTICVCVLC